MDDLVWQHFLAILKLDPDQVDEQKTENNTAALTW